MSGSAAQSLRRRDHAQLYAKEKIEGKGSTLRYAYPRNLIPDVARFVKYAFPRNLLSGESWPGVYINSLFGLE